MRLVKVGHILPQLVVVSDGVEGFEIPEWECPENMVAAFALVHEKNNLAYAVVNCSHGEL